MEELHASIDSLREYAGAASQWFCAGNWAACRWKVHDGLDRQRAKPTFWFYLTLGLGLLFVAGQYIAWQQLRREGLYLATNPSSSFFYVLTVTHALHVLGGLGGLVLIITRLQRLTLKKSTLNAVSRYWHFMDALWIYLLCLLWFTI